MVFLTEEKVKPAVGFPASALTRRSGRPRRKPRVWARRSGHRPSRCPGPGGERRRSRARQRDIFAARYGQGPEAFLSREPHGGAAFRAGESDGVAGPAQGQRLVESVGRQPAIPRDVDYA